MPPTTVSERPDVFRAVARATPDPVVVYDATGAVQWTNEQARARFERPGSSLVGSPVDHILPERGHDVEVSAVDAEGRPFPVAMWVSTVESDGGELTCAVVRDISERHAMVSASERMRDDLIATVSHELRTPLTSILGYTEILVDMGESAVSEPAAQLLAVVQRNAERELKLVEDLLTLASLGTAGMDVRREPTDLVPLAREALEALQVRSDAAGVALSCDACDDLWVAGDSERLGQVLTNLLANAIKFTPAGGRVMVRLLREGDHGILEVIDQGIGLTDEELPWVFERLYRAPRAVAAQIPGAGLGLPIVKGIVDAHGGDIAVESEPGRGTRVQVRLPLAATA